MECLDVSKLVKELAMTSTILLCHNTFFYLYLHYRELIEKLFDNFDNVMCAAPWDPYAEKLQQLGVQCFDVKISRRGINPVSEVVSIRAFAHLFNKVQPDVLLSFSLKPIVYGGHAARISGIPHVFFVVTGLGYVFIGNSIKQRLLRMLVKPQYQWVFKRCRNVFFQNSDDRDFFVEKKLLAERQTVVLSGTGVNPAEFCPQTVGIRGFRGRVLYVGRIIRDKGVYEFVNAARKLKRHYPQAEFQLLGPMDENPTAIRPREIDEWVREDVVQYLGETNDVRPYLSRADVFVLPSYREGLPRATLEAMAMEKPIVTTDVPGCRQTVETGGNGFLVPANDSDSLADAIQRFFVDPSLVVRMGRRSREIVLERYDVDAVSNAIVTTIKTSIGDTWPQEAHAPHAQ